MTTAIGYYGSSQQTAGSVSKRRRKASICSRLTLATALVATVTFVFFGLPVTESWVLPDAPSRRHDPSPVRSPTRLTVFSEVDADEAVDEKDNRYINHPEPASTRRELFQNLVRGTRVVAAAAASTCATQALPTNAYTPDPDKLQESLYFISRVQEATVQQERFIRKLGGTPQLRQKLQLTLRLIDKNYKLLDQINFSSAYVTPSENLVEASEAGLQAVDALQSAIEFVRTDANWEKGQPEDRRDFLTDAMQTCREQLLVYTDYMPADKLRNARYRLEDENIKNRDEFDGDEDAGVYNPVNLPWKPVLKATPVR